MGSIWGPHLFIARAAASYRSIKFVECDLCFTGIQGFNKRINTPVESCFLNLNYDFSKHYSTGLQAMMAGRTGYWMN